MKLVISAEANADFRSIIRFTARRWGTARARIYVDGLSTRLTLLPDHPELGPTADDVSPGLRRYPYISHNAFYRVTGGTIRIIRILHKHMQPDLHLR